MPSRVKYNKPHLSYTDQLQLLKSRGLLIQDESKALHLLEHLSYYRLSGYWYPFLRDKTSHVFKDNTYFHRCFSIYCFDNELRLLVLKELEKIEIAVRAKMIYCISNNVNPFWYSDLNCFSKEKKFKITLNKVERELQRSDQKFIKSFHGKYTDKFPPSWITLEVLSMGTLSMMYGNLKPSKHKKEIARHFGVNSKLFSSWLHTLVYVRNVCAHHSRLWNRELGIQPMKLKNPFKPWLSNVDVSNKKVYYVLSMIKYLNQTIHPNSQLSTSLKSLFAKYPMIDDRAMGFPIDWESEALWK